jgi:hypothetical protein
MRPRDPWKRTRGVGWKTIARFLDGHQQSSDGEIAEISGAHSDDVSVVRAAKGRIVEGQKRRNEDLSRMLNQQDVKAVRYPLDSDVDHIIAIVERNDAGNATGIVCESRSQLVGDLEIAYWMWQALARRYPPWKASAKFVHDIARFLRAWPGTANDSLRACLDRCSKDAKTLRDASRMVGSAEDLFVVHALMSIYERNFGRQPPLGERGPFIRFAVAVMETMGIPPMSGGAIAKAMLRERKRDRRRLSVPVLEQ